MMWNVSSCNYIHWAKTQSVDAIVVWTDELSLTSVLKWNVLTTTCAAAGGDTESDMTLYVVCFTSWMIVPHIKWPQICPWLLCRFFHLVVWISQCFYNKTSLVVFFHLCLWWMKCWIMYLNYWCWVFLFSSFCISSLLKLSQQI